jgi:hypothetical protein
MFSLCNLAPFPVKLPKEKYMFTQILIGKHDWGHVFPKELGYTFPRKTTILVQLGLNLLMRPKKKGIGVMFSLGAWLHLLGATPKENVMP